MTTLRFRKDDKIEAKVFILESADQIEQIGLTKKEADYVKKTYDDDKDKTVVINRYTECYHIFFVDTTKAESKFMERCRKKGASICKWLNANKYQDVLIQNIGEKRCVKMGTAEGMMLANYEFKKYKTDAKSNTLQTIYFLEGTACDDCVEKLNITVEATVGRAHV